jgi:hypothetical protein
LILEGGIINLKVVLYPSQFWLLPWQSATSGSLSGFIHLSNVLVC